MFRRSNRPTTEGPPSLGEHPLHAPVRARAHRRFAAPIVAGLALGVLILGVMGMAGRFDPKTPNEPDPVPMYSPTPSIPGSGQAFELNSCVQERAQELLDNSPELSDDDIRDRAVAQCISAIDVTDE
jgi:hypothetical protein